MQSAAELTEAVLHAGREAGLVAVGVTTNEILEPARTLLHRRKAAGFASSMAFTYRNPDRSTDPATSLPSVETVIAGAWDYRRSEPVLDTTGPVGRIARYSWHDHYADLRVALGTMAEVLRLAGYRAVIKADDNALVDRNVAWRAGLGWYGKNANLLVPGVGSWVVLGAVVTDAPLQCNEQPVVDGCGSCRRCFDGCPTDAIVAPGVVDARRCLAWLVQGPDPMPLAFREAMGDRLYGCDDCQEVCPPARFELAPDAEDDSEPVVELLWLLSASDAEILDRLGRFYIANRDPNVLRRTALIALGNSASSDDCESREVLGRYATGPDPVLAEHAQWALERVQVRA
ncbi:MAG: tRNA epoxyqueuosine(34) reductase QueG [Acidimicrobiales bacterium]|nr:tRNA epoxyqueuosine(34) reductase QueG [Acidimicrobiales bacterium]